MPQKSLIRKTDLGDRLNSSAKNKKDHLTNCMDLARQEKILAFGQTNLKTILLPNWQISSNVTYKSIGEVFNSLKVLITFMYIWHT